MLYVAPLCPARHLPLKGGDQLSYFLPISITALGSEAMRVKLLISPLEGEMSGRTEGGVDGLVLSGESVR